MEYLARLRMGSDKILLKDFQAYCGSIDEFTFFAEQLEFETSILGESTGYLMYKLDKALEKIKNKMGVKALRPFKKICLKLFDADKGINEVHVQFLKMVIQYKAYRQGLEIIQKKQIIKHSSEKTAIEYFYYSAQIYIWLGNFKKAKQHLNLIVNKFFMELAHQKNVFEIILPTILLNLAFPTGGSLQQMQAAEIFNSLGRKEISFSPVTQKNKLEILQQLWVTKDKISQEMASTLLNGSGKINLKLYRLIDKKANQMVEYVKDDIKNMNERVRIDDVKGQDLREFEAMNRVNRFEKLGRYDCKQKMLYLNHVRYSPAQINLMISSCHEMYKILKLKQELENESRFQPRSFGRGGRMGGMGMGMGMGMGGLGSYMM